MPFDVEWIEILKLGVAVLVGGIIGAEREFYDKTAGLRTNILICLGTTMLTMFSIRIAAIEPAEGIIQNDAGRIASYIVAGIGFLGAGAIIRHGERVIGLTTASTIWIVAALGIGIGIGEYVIVGFATVIAFLVLRALHFIETIVIKPRETHEYTVTVRPPESNFERLEKLIERHELRVLERSEMKDGEALVFRWLLLGLPGNHDRLMRTLVQDEDVIRFKA